MNKQRGQEQVYLTKLNENPLEASRRAKFKKVIPKETKDHLIVKTTFQVVKPGGKTSPELMFFRKIKK